MAVRNAFHDIGQTGLRDPVKNFPPLPFLVQQPPILENPQMLAHHMTRNPASGNVMRKLGMTHEGRARQHAKKWDVFEDLELYGILRDEWIRRAKQDA